MIRPGPVLARALGLLAAASMLAAISPWFGIIAGSLLGILFFVSAIEAFWLNSIRVDLTRLDDTVIPLNGERCHQWTLVADNTLPVRAIIRQNWPAAIEAFAEQTEYVIKPTERCGHRLSLHGLRRTESELEPATIILTGIGLIERVCHRGGSARVRVIPNLDSVRKLARDIDRFALRGLGQRVAPHSGKGREFERLREYVAGDDFRDISWKASARHGFWITREFTIEKSQDVVVCIDQGHRMAKQTTRIRHVDHAVNASLLIGYACNRLDDRTGLIRFASKAETALPQGRGRTHLRKLLEASTPVEATEDFTDYPALAAYLKRGLRQRSLVILFTTLPEWDEQRSLVRMAALLQPQHLLLVMSLIDPAFDAMAESLPANHDELCRTLVAKDLTLARRQMILDLQRQGAHVVETAPDDLGIRTVNAYLEIKSRQLL